MFKIIRITVKVYGSIGMTAKVFRDLKPQPLIGSQNKISREFLRYSQTICSTTSNTNEQNKKSSFWEVVDGIYNRFVLSRILGIKGTKGRHPNGNESKGGGPSAGGGVTGW